MFYHVLTGVAKAISSYETEVGNKPVKITIGRLELSQLRAEILSQSSYVGRGDVFPLRPFEVRVQGVVIDCEEE